MSVSPKACSFHHCLSCNAALCLHVQGEPGPFLQFSNLFSLWIQNYFLSRWRSLIRNFEPDGKLGILSLSLNIWQ